jgi:hypothetical protein
MTRVNTELRVTRRFYASGQIWRFAEAVDRGAWQQHVRRIIPFAGRYSCSFAASRSGAAVVVSWVPRAGLAPHTRAARFHRLGRAQQIGACCRPCSTTSAMFRRMAFPARCKVQVFPQDDLRPMLADSVVGVTDRTGLTYEARSGDGDLRGHGRIYFASRPIGLDPRSSMRQSAAGGFSSAQAKNEATGLTEGYQRLAQILSAD